MASAVDSRLAYARLSAVATASRLLTANRGSNNSYTTSWDTTLGSSTNGHARRWGSKRQQKDLTLVLCRSVEVAASKQTFFDKGSGLHTPLDVV